MGASFKDLVAWQKGVEMTLAVYKLTATFPVSERFGLTDQLRRAAVSVPSNIAEGYSEPRKAYISYLRHARGSCNEVETQLEIARALGYGTTQDLAVAENLCQSVSRLVNALIASLLK